MLVAHAERPHAHLGRVRDVRLHRAPVAVHMVVLHPMPLTELHDLGLQRGQMAVVDAREHVVLDLHVEAAAEEAAPPVLRPEVLVCVRVCVRVCERERVSERLCARPCVCVRVCVEGFI